MLKHYVNAKSWQKYPATIIGISVLLAGCGQNREVSKNISNINQVGDNDSFVMNDTWSCKMLAYDFDKYYPIYLKTLDQLQQNSCFASNITMGLPIKPYDIPNVSIPTAPTFNLDDIKNPCLNELKYATDLHDHITNIKEIWGSKCTRRVITKEEEIIYDSPACISPCLPFLSGCYTCSPASTNFADGGKGTQTCASKSDATYAVIEYCKNKKITACKPICRFTPANDVQLRFLGKGLSGTSLTDSYSNTLNFTTAVSFESELKAIIFSAEFEHSIQTTLEFTNSIEVSSQTSHLYQEIKYNPNVVSTHRKEYTGGSTYTCSITKAKILDLSTSAKIGFGLEGEWHGIGGGFSFNVSAGGGRNSTSAKSFSRSGINADGKTLADIKAECAEWSQHALRTYAIAKPAPQVNIVIPVENTTCTYKNDKEKKISEITFSFNDDDSGIISYKARGTLGINKTLSYAISENMGQFKVPVLKINEQNSSISSQTKHKILVSALNKLIAPASRMTNKKDKWQIEYCN